MMRCIFLLVSLTILTVGCGGTSVRNSASMGLSGEVQDAGVVWAKIAAELRDRKDTSPLVISLPKGTYRFSADSASIREYYISNHDQDNPKRVGIPFENIDNVTVDGNGSLFLCRGRMLPLAILNSNNCTFKNFSIDFTDPQILQLNVTAVDKDGITGWIAPDRYSLENGKLIRKGYQWTLPSPSSALAFDGETGHLLYRLADIGYRASKVELVDSHHLRFHGWLGDRIPVGTKLALRGWHRPNPGIFMSHCTNTTLENVTVHYAEGMGLLAQLCENIQLNGFRVALNEDDNRCFTTQADATHFSGCKGIIRSENGLYENMMDDAINVHGTYLRVIKRIDNRTLRGRYEHGQSWGFEWGRPGDTVQFVQSQTMEVAGSNRVKSIKPVHKPTAQGEREFDIVFEVDVPAAIDGKVKFGIENLEWTPSVIFNGNIVRNNRARGALFSTPKQVVCEGNFFDHTHGTGILLCGDCNGWYETGACRDVTIRNNRFLNALTAEYQFTNAVISIYPVIPDLKNQKQFFHSNITIEDNTFETFDHPILYAKSVDSLVFRNNSIRQTFDFKPFHWNKHMFFFEHVDHIRIEHNTFPHGFDFKSSLRLHLTPDSAIIFTE